MELVQIMALCAIGTVSKMDLTARQATTMIAAVATWDDEIIDALERQYKTDEIGDLVYFALKDMLKDPRIVELGK